MLAFTGCTIKPEDITPEVIEKVVKIEVPVETIIEVEKDWPVLIYERPEEETEENLELYYEDLLDKEELLVEVLQSCSNIGFDEEHPLVIHLNEEYEKLKEEIALYNEKLEPYRQKPELVETPKAAAAPQVEYVPVPEPEPEPKVEVPSGTQSLYTAGQFKVLGVVYFNGWRWTWYSERVLPGGGLSIPGRHGDENGFICDENDYICLASMNLDKGTVIDTPFGKQGKIYDYCETNGTVDVYVNW